MCKCHVLNVAIYRFVILAALACIFSSPLQAGPLALEISLHENARDGCTACQCKLVETLPVGESSKWWFTFAGVEIDPVTGWRRKGPLALSHCGLGEWKDARKQLESTNGIPYVIVTAEFDSRPTDGDDSDVEIQWRIQQFDRFVRAGKPKYSSVAVGPGRGRSDGFQSIVQALVANDREREQFRTDNLVVELSEPLDRGRTSANHCGCYKQVSNSTSFDA